MNILLTFLEGLATTFSPCIFPMLPILIASNLSKSTSRLVGLVIGFILSFGIVSLVSVHLLGFFDIETAQKVALYVSLVFGVVLLVDYFYYKFNMLSSAVISRLPELKYESNCQFVTGLCLGAILSLLWVPCAGPLYFSALAHISSQGPTIQGFLTFTAFAVGAILPIGAIVLFGQNIVKLVQNHLNTVRRIVGLVLIISSIYTLL